MTPDPRLVDERVALAEQIDALRGHLAELDRQIAEGFDGRGNQSIVLDDGRKVTRTARWTDQWDNDALRTAVLDSRLFDRTSGELVDESPVDKVLAVWRLDRPRVTALKDRGISKDDFCASSFNGWSIRVEGGTS